LGIFAFPILHGLQAIAFWAITGNALWALCYLASLPISALLMHVWRKQAIYAWRNAKLLAFKLSKPKQYEQMIKEWENIKQFTSNIKW